MACAANVTANYDSARQWEPEGQWFLESPLGFVDGPNKYRFAGNDPVNFGDPTGLSQAGHPFDDFTGSGFNGSARDAVFSSLGQTGQPNGGFSGGRVSQPSIDFNNVPQFFQSGVGSSNSFAAPAQPRLTGRDLASSFSFDTGLGASFTGLDPVSSQFAAAFAAQPNPGFAPQLLTNPLFLVDSRELSEVTRLRNDPFNPAVRFQQLGHGGAKSAVQAGATELERRANTANSAAASFGLQLASTVTNVGSFVLSDSSPSFQVTRADGSTEILLGGEINTDALPVPTATGIGLVRHGANLPRLRLGIDSNVLRSPQLNSGGPLNALQISVTRRGLVVEQPRDAFGRFASKTGDELRPGGLRELRVRDKLVGRFGSDAVQPEQFLRTADGRIAIDPVTGEARRIDFAVIRNSRAVGTVEVTSKTASKRGQRFKEDRIRESGGTFIHDRVSGQLVDFANAPQKISRRR